MTEPPPLPAEPPIRVGPAVGTWALSWVLGMVIVAPIVIVASGAELGDDLSIPVLGAATASAWTVMLAALWLASRRFGSADVVADFAVRFRPVDLVGVPIGIAVQLLAIPVLYVPLQRWWPDTFSDERLEERASELVDRAGGAMTLLLILIVAIGAPVVEELVYRGLLQRSLASVLGPTGGLLLASIWFTVVHPSPVEYPGLAVAALAFGGCLVWTGRIGTSIVTHAAFNATGIAVLLATAGG